MIQGSARFKLPFALGVLSLLLISISKIVETSQGEKNFLIAYAASASIVISVLVIRFYSINTGKFDELINKNNPFDKKIPGKRFLNWLAIAMVVGLIATVVINSYDFILGMIIYLLMQIALIVAFSGITVINPIKIWKSNVEKNIKQTAFFSFIFWLFITTLVYIVFVYSGSDSLIVVPYVFFLGLMAHFSWYGLAYNRPARFRYMIALASVIFVFSDALIGNNVYGEMKGPNWLYSLIDITYVLNIYLMSQAVLFSGYQFE